jgi:hypothetical protein
MPNEQSEEYTSCVLTCYTPHYDQIAIEHQSSLTLNQCCQEQKKHWKSLHTKHDEHKP